MTDPFKILDKIFVRFLSIKIDEGSEYFHARRGMENIDEILHDMAIIDSKSSALLTHISLMFVVVGFFLSESKDQEIIQLLLLVEFVIYAITATILLRCVEIMGPPVRKIPNEKDVLKEIYYFEITLRRGVYQYCLRSALILTAALIPIVVLKYLL